MRYFTVLAARNCAFSGSLENREIAVIKPFCWSNRMDTARKYMPTLFLGKPGQVSVWTQTMQRRAQAACDCTVWVGQE
jgi:hypothetical protein